MWTINYITRSHNTIKYQIMDSLQPDVKLSTTIIGQRRFPYRLIGEWILLKKCRQVINIVKFHEKNNNYNLNLENNIYINVLINS